MKQTNKPSWSGGDVAGKGRGARRLFMPKEPTSDAADFMGMNMPVATAARINAIHVREFREPSLQICGLFNTMHGLGVTIVLLWEHVPLKSPVESSNATLYDFHPACISQTPGKSGKALVAEGGRLLASLC